MNSRPPHRRAPLTRPARCKPVHSCCSSRAGIASRQLGSARMTTRSPPSSSPMTVRATCRNRRATRWRCTADPTLLPITNPIRGPGSPCGPSAPRRACTTMSGCTARMPCFTVALNSEDRFIRYRAGSTAALPGPDSGGQRAAPLAAPIRHDRPPRAGAHPQPKTVYPRSAPVVGLEGPFALGHARLSSAYGA
jgi:hypothetical protein